MWLRRTAPTAYLYQPLPDAPDLVLALDESGPGYQLIEIGSPEGPRRPRETLVPLGQYIVFNSELFIPATLEWDPKLALGTWDGALDYDTYKSAQNPTIATGLAGTPSLTPGSGTAGAPRSTFVVTGTTSASQILWRLSAFNPDKRIAAGRVMAAAYLTSDLDKDLLNTGLGAVGRYALPNPFPATHLYRVTPPLATAFHAGTVRPAYGQAGGGVEVVLGSPAPAVLVPPPLPHL